MYDKIKRFAARPALFSEETALALWTRPHIAEQMLSFHLDPETSLASRPVQDIDRIVRALDGKLQLKGKRVCDLGCGPGLYAERFADAGADVLGVDVSPGSIDFATARHANAQGRQRYLVADYLRDSLGEDFDVVTLIYFDFCALSPANRASLLKKINRMLRKGGCLALDVVSETSFSILEEDLEIEQNLMGGFWAPGEYVGIHRRWLYAEERVCLDHYGIFEDGQDFEIFNWMQYFSLERLREEIEDAGFTDVELFDSLNLEPVSDGGNEIGAIARRA
jgi:SAM-dependent methyltransferase